MSEIDWTKELVAVTRWGNLHRRAQVIGMAMYAGKQARIVKAIDSAGLTDAIFPVTDCGSMSPEWKIENKQ